MSISLTITPQTNVLDGIRLFEPVDVVLLDKLIHSDLLRSVFNNSNAGQIYTTEKEQLIKYRDTMSDGRASIYYSRPKNNPFGRSNPACAVGLFPIRREIRHTLAVERYHDYDVKNAHPSILLQVCQKADIECPRLYLYVKQRQDYYDLVVKDYGCTEEQAKGLFIILLYGGGIKRWALKNEIDISKVAMQYKRGNEILENADITAFRLELAQINGVIVSHNPELVRVAKEVKAQQGKTDYNLPGTVCAYYLQEYEIRILEQVFIYCKVKKYIQKDQCVLAADGIMLEKCLIKDPDALLLEFNQVVKDKTGFDLIFTRKEMTKGYNSILEEHVTHTFNFNITTFHNIVAYNVPFDSTERDEAETRLAALQTCGVTDKALSKKLNVTIVTQNAMELETALHLSYLSRKTYFEYFHFKVMMPLCYGRKINKGHDLVSDVRFEKTYKNLERDFAAEWTSDRKIRTFENIDFAPPPVVVGIDTFNVFGGLCGERLIFGYKQTLSQTQLGVECNIFIKQLWYLCGKSNECLEYTLNYLSHLIQKPGELPLVALAFKSNQGVGKNMFFEKLVEMIAGDEYGLSTTQLDHVVGRFSMIHQKLLIILDEASGKATFSSNDHIKSFITNPKVPFEKKGIDAIQIRNCSRLLFFFNEGCGVKIEQTDRRFVAMECSKDKCNDPLYFVPLVAAYEDETKMRNLYLFLKNRDISNYNKTDRPITDLYKEIQSSTTPCEQKYFTDRYETSWRHIGDVRKDWKEHYADYSSWCKDRGFKVMLGTTFTKRLNDDKYNFISRTKTVGVNYYNIDQDLLGKFIDTYSPEYTDPIYDTFPEIYTPLL